MADKTVEALKIIKAFAEEQGAVVDRVEVRMAEREGQTCVEFTAHLSPKPLEQATACTGYYADAGE
ncbi:hypothetical protein [Companilactobacillus sp.]|uniref:hypothetical protein n=1 Tax=Companilactobacillus sp. TaxID=2767905 RepID=UPI002613D80E|nr:hypothetical protein [Companilactobacillus sp.]